MHDFSTWVILNDGHMEDADRFVVDPVNPGVVYRTGCCRVWRSDDRGASWTLIYQVNSNWSPFITGLVIDPTDPDRLILSLDRALLESRDGGVSWHYEDEGINIECRSGSWKQSEPLLCNGPRAIVVSPLPGGPTFVAPERVVLLSIDTLRADHVGCYGATDANTPNLDTIGAQGVRFEVALSPVPLTLPAHASLLTGLEPPGHGVRDNATFPLENDLPTLATLLAERGFRTGAFIAAFPLVAKFGFARGFEHFDEDIESVTTGEVENR